MQSLTISEARLREARRLSLETVATFDVLMRVPPSLHLLPAAVCPKPQKLVEDMALILSVFLACRFRYPKAEGVEWLTRENILDAVPHKQHKFLHSSRKWTNLMDRSEESLWALVWALGFVEELDFRYACGDQLVHLMPDLKKKEPSTAWRAAARLLPFEEILLACDLAYCIHADKRQRPYGFPSVNPGLDASTPRLHALVWMLCAEEWERINLNA